MYQCISIFYQYPVSFSSISLSSVEGPVLFLSGLFSMIQQHFLSGIAVGGLVNDLLTKFQNVLVGDFQFEVFGESLGGSLEIALIGFENLDLKKM